jgi:hypothetical protein
MNPSLRVKYAPLFDYLPDDMVWYTLKFLTPQERYRQTEEQDTDSQTVIPRSSWNRLRDSKYSSWMETCRSI